MPKLPANGTHEAQERYSTIAKRIITAQQVVRKLFNRNYEGDPKAGSVKIPVRAVTTINDYDILEGTPLTNSTTAYDTIVVDKHKAVNELIDGFEADSVPDNMVANRLEVGTIAVGNTLEADAIAVLETQGTVIAATAPLLPDTAYGSILAAVSSLKKTKLAQNPSEIAVIVSVDTNDLLLLDDRYSARQTSLTDEERANGVVSKIGGAFVYESTMLSADVDYIAFIKEFATAIDENTIPLGVNDLSDGKHIGSSALQGRFLYANKVTNSTCVIARKHA